MDSFNSNDFRKWVTTEIEKMQRLELQKIGFEKSSANQESYLTPDQVGF